jgi:glycosyltransferase involved in cell wall biosynthesis
LPAVEASHLLLPQRLRSVAAHFARSAVRLLVIPLLRGRARKRRLRQGEVTVVTVNWNSGDQLAVFLRAVRRRSPKATKILVVDNASRDRSGELLARSPDVRSARLPFNLGHDLALDLGFLLADTEFVVALDVDAFPVQNGWLDELLAPLSAGSEISGARLNREYVHPCCLAMRTARFVESKHTFRSRYRPRSAGTRASGDVGEGMSQREHGRLHFFEITSQRGPGSLGTVFGDLVYHNFYSTRFRTTTELLLDDAVSADDAASAWDEAVERYGLQSDH